MSCSRRLLYFFIGVIAIVVDMVEEVEAFLYLEQINCW